MQIPFLAIIQQLGEAFAALAAAYSLLALAATYWGSRRLASYSGGMSAAVSVLKPLCGAESRLYEDLRSFCNQDYPSFQLVLGVSDVEDGAVQIVRRLQREFAGLDIELVIDPAQHGCNRKISNLINMLPRAKHDYLVIADSDVAVPRDYLARISAPLADPRIGLVTCPYHGRAIGGTASELGAMFINEWFMPSVYVAALFGSLSFVSGATMALRRGRLDKIGGFARLRDQLADDYRLGELIRAEGSRVLLSELTVETSVDEPSLAALWRHQLRWLRTIQSIQPFGYALSSVTFSVPAALLGAALAGFHPLAVTLLAVTAAARLVLHCARGKAVWRPLALLPLHDALLPLLWCWSFCSRQVSWREQTYGVRADGSLHRVS